MQDHPVIRCLVAATDPYRSYFALTYLSSELARCQQQLAPSAPLFNFVRDRLAAAMRQALLDDLVPTLTKGNAGVP